MNLIVLKEIDEKENDRIIKQADKSMKKFDKVFKEIRLEVSKIEPHSRIYLVNEMIASIISYTNLPPFVITSILDGLKHVFMSGIRIEEKDIDKHSRTYIG